MFSVTLTSLEIESADQDRILVEATFHLALIPLGKVGIHLFSLQLWVNGRGSLSSLALKWQLL